ncbi:MAG: hypothetical protein QXO37_06910 [Candidatus Nitrosocaldaceae archaeon]
MSQNIGNVRIISGSLAGLSEQDFARKEEAAIAAAIRKALTNNVADSPSGLVVRDIYPDKDLLDGNGNAISSRRWVQPVSGTWTTGDSDVVVYKTGANVKYDKKVYVIYGVKQVGVAPYKATGSFNTTSITINKGESKTIITADLQAAETDQHLTLRFANPVVFGTSEEMRILLRPKPNVSGTTDTFMLLGKVIEAVGETVNG